MLPCFPLPCRCRRSSDGPVGLVAGRCAVALRLPAACPSCPELVDAMSCAGPLHALWHLKVSLTPWRSTACNSPSIPSLQARRISCHSRLPSRVRPGALCVPAVCTPRLAEWPSDILNPLARAATSRQPSHNWSGVFLPITSFPSPAAVGSARLARRATAASSFSRHEFAPPAALSGAMLEEPALQCRKAGVFWDTDFCKGVPPAPNPDDGRERPPPPCAG